MKPLILLHILNVTLDVVRDNGSKVTKSLATSRAKAVLLIAGPFLSVYGDATTTEDMTTGKANYIVSNVIIG